MESAYVTFIVASNAVECKLFYVVEKVLKAAQNEDLEAFLSNYVEQ